MEILASSPVTATTWWGILCILGMACGFVALLICMFEDKENGIIVCAIITILSLIIMINCGISAPTGEMNYTVEITDPSKYQTLIEEGYSFRRVYDSREIYTITGEPLE